MELCRLKIPEGITTYKDLVHGTVKFANRNLDDGIIMKSEGLPTYHLANVVDDRTMNISHVLRGEVCIFLSLQVELALIE